MSGGIRLPPCLAVDVVAASHLAQRLAGCTPVATTDIRTQARPALGMGDTCKAGLLAGGSSARSGLPAG
jgi:hypothetical protein